MKKIIINFLFTFALIISPLVILTINADPPNPDGPGVPKLPVNSGAPIDGGVTILIGAGLAYGAKKLFNKNKTNP